MAPNDKSQTLFRQLKEHCVPLLANASLSPPAIPVINALLADIARILEENKESLSPPVISYVFFPLSAVLRRNALSSIPDRTLEGVLNTLAILCETWWWTMDIATWEQLFMLCSAILGGISTKGKERQRSDETSHAAVRCLWALLHERPPNTLPASIGMSSDKSGHDILSVFQRHARTDKFIPIIGQTVNSLLFSAESTHRPLQVHSLQLLHVIIKLYLSDGFVPSILPGVASTMCKIALGRTVAKGWANGEVVAAALLVLQEIIVRAIGDTVCIQEGAVKGLNDLEDLMELSTSDQARPSSPNPNSKYDVSRSHSWLHGTASQLHIALNSLRSLTTHPTASALLGLSTFCATILRETTLTLPQSQSLLIAILLSLMSSDLDVVSRQSRSDLLSLLTPAPQTSSILVPVLLQILQDALSSLPRLIPLHEDAKVEHAAKLVEAICSLAILPEMAQHQNRNVVSVGVGKLLGPSGGVHKWGWGLLAVLGMNPPPLSVTPTPTAQLLLESDQGSMDMVVFPDIQLQHVSTFSTQKSLERMFRALGRTAEKDALFSVEWFIDVGLRNQGRKAAGALWCACRLLEGISGVTLDATEAPALHIVKRSKPIERFARGLTRSISESWDSESEDQPPPREATNQDTLDVVTVEHVTGLIAVRETMNHKPTLPSVQKSGPESHPLLRKALLLQLLSVTSGILQARFTSTFIHTLYPILHSLISPAVYLSTTALASLQYISNATSYATPASMLLSNFDYALDAVSRRLTRRWLDVDATRVLAMLIHLVGPDVVQKAGDVVEECFDRLDEYHGYEVIVDGLITVLAEVVEVIASDASAPSRREEPSKTPRQFFEAHVPFVEWFYKRHDKTDSPEKGDPVSSESTDPDTLRDHDADTNSSEERPPTPTQALTKQIVIRSMYFLTHDSPQIRSRILTLLGSAASVLPEGDFLPSLHHAWPFILNRLSDSESYVVSSAAMLVETLAVNYGEFMHRRIWDDVWPRFKTILKKLDASDSRSALARRGPSAVGTESAYTHSHRLYRAILKTMDAAATHVQIEDNAVWEVIIMFRRFLHSQAHEELQQYAKHLYVSLAANNEDAVWFALSGTQGHIAAWPFLREKWDIDQNVKEILAVFNDT
ncbi:hypothetical protein K474DRAFT_1615922 [Panus rudis PR-1116 ss-1]|nr:hypothetical protein K474DRAFT_1615922 [Panus rudis PR-1116 ss-1]